MIVRDYNEWLNDTDLTHWRYRSSVASKCKCSTPELIELINQDFCIRGSIDTVVCISCDKVHSLKINR